jgi:hypothetical protein
MKIPGSSQTAKPSMFSGMKIPGTTQPKKTSGLMPKFFGGAFDMGSMTGMTGMAGITGMKGTTGMTDMAGMAGKAAGIEEPEVEEVVDTVTTLAATVSQAPVSKLSLMDSFFGYTLVDSKKPTPNQTAYKSELHTISIVEFSLLAIVALYYGLDKTLLKNQL